MGDKISVSNSQLCSLAFYFPLPPISLFSIRAALPSRFRDQHQTDYQVLSPECIQCLSLMSHRRACSVFMQLDQRARNEKIPASMTLSSQPPMALLSSSTSSSSVMPSQKEEHVKYKEKYSTIRWMWICTPLNFNTFHVVPDFKIRFLCI